MLTPSKARSGARWQRERGHHIVGLGLQLDQAVVRMTRCQISLPSSAIAAATVGHWIRALEGSSLARIFTNVAVFDEHPKVRAVERDGITFAGVGAQIECRLRCRLRPLRALRTRRI